VKSENIYNITVLGTGMIGPDITLLCAMNHYSVIMVGRTEQSIDRGLSRIRKNLGALVDAEVFIKEEAEDILSCIKTETLLSEAVRKADFVFEGIIEDLNVKQEVFLELDKYCPPHTILASSTSGLSPNDIGAKIQRKDKMLVAHFWNPPYLVPLVEVVAGENTTKETINIVLEFLERLDKKPVLLKKDILGHIGNRLQHAMFREAINLVEQGVADPKDIDQVILNSLGPRYSMIGPMEYIDSVGLDLNVAVQSYLFEALDASKSPQKLLLEKYNKGDYGLKTGKGFFDWSKKDPDDFVARQNKRFIDRLKKLKGVVPAKNKN